MHRCSHRCCSFPIELEFKLVYVGDAKEDKQDQVLDVVVIDAVAPGTYKFVFEVQLCSGYSIEELLMFH